MTKYQPIVLPIERAERRRNPRWFDTDWMLLSQLARAIRAMAAAHVRPGQVAIDLGCGSRPYADIFRAAGAIYLGAELDGSAELMIDGGGRVDAKDGTADLILSFQVLEHVRDIDTYFAEAHRLLKPDGELILSTHGTWLYHPHPEDHRRWTRQGLRTDIEMRGFELVECVSLVGPLAWTTMIRLTGYAFALRKLPVVGRPVAAALALVMNLRAAIEDRITPRAISNENGCVYLVRCRRR